MNNFNLQHQQRTERLTDAFRVFNELSENLAQSYQNLQQQVTQLNSQLAAARSERLATLSEKEKLATRLQQILAALPAAVVVLNARQKVIDCNQQALALLGEPLLGQMWPDVIARSLFPVADSPHERRLKDGRIVSLTRNYLGGNSEQIVLLSDVSELRSLQDTVAQQKHLSAMGEMVASLAHQVRTPLATAILYASHIANPAVPESKRQRFSDRILERLQYLERQVNDMLVFAKQGRLAMQGFSWPDLLGRLVERMEQFDGRFDLDNQIPPIELLGNEDALAGAFSNLLNNAIEAGATAIGMRARYCDGGIEISIRDNGPGIGAEQKKQLFEPFYTTKTQGTGLGLAVVDSVVKAHNGQVSCESEAGKGCNFVVFLPLIEHELSLSAAGEAVKMQENSYETV